MDALSDSVAPEVRRTRMRIAEGGRSTGLTR